MIFDPTILYYSKLQCAEIRCVEDSITDRQINRIKSLNRIEYWLGCKWDNCWRPKYDCMGLIIASLAQFWIHVNQWRYLYGETFARENQIWIHDWKRWDYLFMLNLTGEINHIAIITKPFDWLWYWILDTYEKKTRATERYIPLRWKYYANSYEVIIAEYKNLD